MGKRVGPYELKRRIGKGSYGTVFLGKHLPSRNKIAVKMIDRQNLSPEHQSRLEQEILCQRSVESEFIVKLLDVQKTDHNFYLILEYCEGGDLGVFIKKNGPVDEASAQVWMQQLASGFRELRAKNILHRDLKLSNILMTEASPRATLKIADFGLSRFLDTNLAQTWLGTPLYMAPEIFQVGAGYDSKADIWSLGMVLYEMIAGHLPFTAHGREEIPFAQRNLKPPPRQTSATCVDLLQRMLAYEPSNRISFEELFVHPFILDSTIDEDSVKASKGSSDVPMISGEAEVVAKESKVSQSGDFIIISDDDCSADDFVFIAKDAHPAVNLAEEANTIEGVLEASELIIKFAEKLRQREELLGCFSLFVKACQMIGQAFEKSEEIRTRHKLTAGSHPSFFEQIERTKALFLNYEAHTESLSHRVELLLSTDLNKLTSLGTVGSQGVALSLLYNYAIGLCKEGAQDEFIRDYGSAKDKYAEAVVLLEIVCGGEHLTDDLKEWETVESITLEAKRRLDTVKVKLATA
jgi:serine/threonine-protein kinase ULK/ATG1